MKKLIAVAYAIIVICISAVAVSANNQVQLMLDVDDAQKDRLFDVNICADCDVDISGGEFILTYDSKIVDFRDVSSEYFSVQVKEYDDKLHIVFASANKVDLVSDTTLLSVKFKCINRGECEFSLSCNECVNFELEKLSMITQPLTVKVSDNAVEKTKSSAENKTQGSLVNKSQKSDSKAQDNDSNTQQSQDDSQLSYNGYDNGGYTQDISTNTKAILYGVCAAVAVLLLVYLGYLLGKKSQKNKD